MSNSDDTGKPSARKHEQAIWQPISAAPFDRDLRLAVVDGNGVAHPLTFPSRRVFGGWIKSQTKVRLEIDPTHWQEWPDSH
ncbi:MAG TPA: hypothetical protein VMF32_03855 [Xanthobacteraceae bacterium]|nr:hypothetical protein [Xanthobacteraceae bacterium]